MTHLDTACKLPGSSAWTAASGPDQGVAGGPWRTAHKLAVGVQESAAQFTSTTRLATSIFQVPLALVCLADEPGRWIAGVAPRTSLPEQLQPHHQDVMHTALAVAATELVVVEDTSQHELFKQAAFVAGPPGVRFFAGAPLYSSSDSDRVLGVLAILDTRVRCLGPRMLAMMANFAALVAEQAEQSQAAAAAAQAAMDAAKAAAAAEDVLLHTIIHRVSTSDEREIVVDVRHPDWPILFANQAWTAYTGMDVQPGSGGSFFWRVAKAWGGHGANCTAATAALQETMHDAVAAGVPACLRVVLPGQAQPMRVTLRPVASRAEEYKSNSEPDSPIATVDGVPTHATFLSSSTLDDQPAASSRSSSAEPHTSKCPASQARDTPFWFIVAPTKGQQGEVMLSGPTTPESSQLLWGPNSSSFNSGSSAPLGSRGGSRSRSMNCNDLLQSSSSVSLPRSKYRQLQEHGHMNHEAFTEIELGPVLGEGAYGRVHRAMWHGALVAVKTMNTTEDVVDSEGGAQGALVEAVLSRDLSHPHIIQTHDYALRSEMVEDDQGHCTRVHHVWIVQQYCNRGTLAECMKKGQLRQTRQPGGPPNAIAILQTAQEVASAVTYLHSQNLIHGDLSSNNVLLNSSTRDHRRFTALVSDFGLAKLEEDAQGGHTYGTVPYMPPELLSKGQVSKSMDVYSFGVLLWEMWTGSRAWASYTRPAILHMVASGSARLDPPADAPAAYQSLIERCLSFEPSQRPAFSQVLQKVSQMLEAELAAAHRTELGRRGGFAEARAAGPAASHRPPGPARSNSLQAGAAITLAERQSVMHSPFT